MARKAWCFRASSVAVVLAAASVAAAQDLRIDAQVDKTTVEVGQPVTLTISLSGDLSGVQLPPPQFPEGLIVAAQSQSTSIAFRAGVQERATGLVFVLVPQRDGTFTLGPFPVTHGKQMLETPVITLTVSKSALPPNLRRQLDGPRFTL
jgi:uncharacterized protein (DUF58 family)